MSNPNPFQARLAKALKDQPGDLLALRVKGWAALSLALESAGHAEDDEGRRKWLGVFSRLYMAYANSYAIGEIEPRLEAVEKALKEQAYAQTYGPTGAGRNGGVRRR